MWRLAGEADMERAETGAAVAAWYRALHAAGREVVTRPTGPPGHLRREIDALSPEVILAVGTRFGLPDDPVWALAADAIEPLRAAMLALPETLVYDDFHWTNLALSREPRSGPPVRRAVVFDYHLLGIGLAAGDCRNVLGPLGSPPPEQEAFRHGFRAAYGPIDEREALLDAPVAVLYSWALALQRPHLPKWLPSDLERWLRDGALVHRLRDFQSVDVGVHDGAPVGIEHLPLRRRHDRECPLDRLQDVQHRRVGAGSNLVARSAASDATTKVYRRRKRRLTTESSIPAFPRGRAELRIWSHLSMWNCTLIERLDLSSAAAKAAAASSSANRWVSSFVTGALRDAIRSIATS